MLNYLPVLAWLEWKQWGTCSTTCGSGKQVRERACSKIGQCKGNPQESRKCTGVDCGNSLLFLHALWYVQCRRKLYKICIS